MDSLLSFSVFGISWVHCVGAGLAFVIGYLVWYYTLFIRSGIPGPLPIPFYVSIKRSKEAFYICEQRWIQAYGKVVGEPPTLLISDVKILKQMLVKEFSNFRNRGSVQLRSARLSNMLISLKNDRWKKIRHTISPAFTSSRIKTMAGIFNECVEGIVLQQFRRSAKEGQPVEIRKLYGSYSSGCIAIAGFGLQLDTRADDDFTLSAFEKNAKDFFFRVKSSKWLMVGLLQDFIPKCIVEYFDIGLVSQASESFLFDMSTAIFKKREQGKVQGDFVDIMQLMVNAHELDDENEEPLGVRSSEVTNKKVKMSMEDVVSQCVMILTAGYETTTACLVFTSYLLASHPDVQEKLATEVKEAMHGAKTNCVTFDLFTEMPYLEMVVNESLRLYPPITRVTRTCNHDTTLQGLHIQKGTRIIAPTWTIHRDPVLWHDALTFNPDRFSAENKDSLNMDAFLPFGYGPRSCLGNRFALMEIKIALARTLTEFKIEMAEDTPEHLELGKGVFLAPQHPVPLKFAPRT